MLRAVENAPIVAAAFSDVGDLLAPPQAVIRPRILWRVLRGNVRKAPVTTTEPSVAAAANLTR